MILAGVDLAGFVVIGMTGLALAACGLAVTMKARRDMRMTRERNKRQAAEELRFRQQRQAQVDDYKKMRGES